MHSSMINCHHHQDTAGFHLSESSLGLLCTESPSLATTALLSLLLWIELACSGTQSDIKLAVISSNELEAAEQVGESH